MATSVTLRIPSDPALSEEILSRFTAEDSGIQILDRLEFGEEYDLQQVYRSDMGGMIEVAAHIVNIVNAVAAILSLRAAMLSLKTPIEKKNEESGGEKERRSGPPLFLVKGGREYDLTKLSESELRELLG